jgi:hypothetical protein
MDNKVITPLSIISLFFSFTEIMVSYTVISTYGPIQIYLTFFIIFFPLFVATCFFTILWNKPSNFYAPKDFQDDSSYLRVLETQRIDPTSTQIEGDIKKKIDEYLTSEFFIKTIKGLKADEKDDSIKEKMKNAAKNISDNIIDSNFFTVVLSSNPNIKTTYPISFFQDFNHFLDTIFYWLHENDIDVRAYYYGEDWILINSKTHKPLISSRMIIQEECGRKIDDKRSLSDVGITAGLTLELKVIRVRDSFNSGGS